MESSPASDKADTSSLREAASEFASYPGVQNDASAKEFLDRFPLPFLFGVLQTEVDVAGLEQAIVECLDRILRTRYGASLLPHYVDFIAAGLGANSPAIKCLACKSISYTLENSEDKATATEILVGHNIYPLLINCLVDGDEQTSTVSLNAIKSIAKTSQGIHVIFPPNNTEEALQLKDIAGHSSSEARIRILSLIKDLFSLSESFASAIYESNLLSLFELEINSRNDILATLSALEILYELVESSHSSTFLLKSSLLDLLTNIIRNDLVDSILRSRAMLISGRLLYPPDSYRSIEDSRVKQLLTAIDRRLNVILGQNTGEVEIVLESLGLIGSSAEGANFLLTSSSHGAKLVIESAFDRQDKGKQLAALLAFGSISGANRAEERRILNDNAEGCLKHLVYETAANSSKLMPSGLFLAVLQQEPNMRLAAYRLISALVSRAWCLIEVCSKLEIISLVVDANIEDTKIGMEARFDCCAAISNALSASSLVNDAKVAEMAAMLQEAVRRGPYLTKKHVEPQPLVITAERF
ncbi:hypothetical protein AXF42_Ash011069 [Apostasia shenzhenica]|uniref:26S proteasome non-ATPase regulatory subunit 5 n=1 Tax=Apostasia shenzhenica TaxID=1088818 RepID=A0A2H9ZR14_9ASPA|nr:hypothetical protein AXF42_Ash011069 [Apostasia shenzhenica]